MVPYTFGLNFCDQRTQHSPQLKQGFLKLLICALSEEFEIICKQQMIIKFTGRTSGDLKKAVKLPITTTPTSFGNIGRN